MPERTLDGTLAMHNQRLGIARKRVARQRARVAALENTADQVEAEKLLHLLEQSLELMRCHRDLLKRRQGQRPPTTPTRAEQYRADMGPSAQRERWYRLLAASDRGIVAARARIARLQAQRASLACDDRHRDRATELLELFKHALQAMDQNRATILTGLRTYPLPG
jgi:hypothetical protein